MATRIELVVPTMFGTEATVAHEVRALGYETSDVSDGRVTFLGDAEAIARANIHLRCGERVLIQLGTFTADTFDALFEGVRALPWEEWIPKDGAFPVKGSSVKSALHSIPDCQSIVKKAIVNRLGAHYGLGWLPETGAVYQVQFSILRDRAALMIDTSGASLHKRGYRAAGVQAPLRETLAFAMIDTSRWRGDRPLMDPFCGSGTIPIEAALLAARVAPGLRRRFAAEAWTTMDQTDWADARTEALAQIDRAARPVIFASDIDPAAVRLTEENARKAGVDKLIRIEQCDAARVTPFTERGAIICNPPYGERLMDKRSCEALYRMMGESFARFPQAGAYILTSHEGFEQCYGRAANKRRKLYNGMLKCCLYQYFPASPPHK